MKCLAITIVTGTLATVCGCMSGGRHASELHSERERRMTVGAVQREIREGMSETEVAVALGSPNIITRDNHGLTSWVYDKIATEASYSNDRGAAEGAVGAGGLPGGSALILGGVGGSYGKSAGAAAMTQRTLTVIIKFSEAGLVESFSYHSSSF